jgi:hypothetical protein
MAYSQGGLIQAADVNGFIRNNTTNFNRIWGDTTGTGNFGYGQNTTTNQLSAANVAVVNNIVNVNPWQTLVASMVTAGAHQGTTVSLTPAPAVGGLIQFLTNLSANLTSLENNRLNASSQGSSTSATGSRGSAWGTEITFTATVSFSSNNAARYFFNCGGQIRLSMAHSTQANTVNTLVSDLCGDLGTIVLSSGGCTIAGTTYTGITKIGGSSPSGTSTNTGLGFYSLTSGAQTVHTQSSDLTYMGGGYPVATTNYTTNSRIYITAAYNGSGTITLTARVDVSSDIGGNKVNSGTTCTCTVNPPETTNLTNSWGTPTVSVPNI